MDEGYIKLWRKSLESGLIQNPHLWTIWCWCLMKATWKPIKQMVGYQMIELLPGQFIFGRRAAADELEVGEQTIRTCMVKLKNLKNLTIKVTNKFSIVTICNWDIYQNEDSTSNQQSNQQVTSNQPATNHKQEVKEVKELKEVSKKYYGEHVCLTPDEHQKLIDSFGARLTGEMIERMNLYAEQIGSVKFKTKYKSHYATILNWHRLEGKKAHGSSSSWGKTRVHTGDGEPDPDDTPRD
jgi:hypothetical protein